jgi:RNA-directed DNA polymerase
MGRIDMNVVDLIQSKFPLSAEEARRLLVTAPSRYKVHEIEKRNGRGKRTIAQPTAEVKVLQRLLMEEFLSGLPISDAAKAYRKNHNIVDHALPHAKNQYLLKLDFKDFFPSLRSTDFIRHLKIYSALHLDDVKLLARAFFWRPRGQRKLMLSIGAPSSPFISNTLLFEFDVKLIEYCKVHSIVYTRYADDIALSTNHPSSLGSAHNFIRELIAKIRHPLLELNEGKTVYTSKKHHRELTGLTLSNEGNASIGRDKKRLIRSMAFNYSVGKLELENHSKLRGWIAFMLSVDPLFVKSLEKMIGNDAFESLMKG